MSKTFRIGDIVTAKVTGVQNYGVFLELDEDTQGLIHISECKHGYMEIDMRLINPFRQLVNEYQMFHHTKIGRAHV